MKITEMKYGPSQGKALLSIALKTTFITPSRCYYKFLSRYYGDKKSRNNILMENKDWEIKVSKNNDLEPETVEKTFRSRFRFRFLKYPLL